MSLKERAARADLAGKALSKNRPPKAEANTTKSEPEKPKATKPARPKPATTPAAAARTEAAKQFGLPKPKAKTAAQRQAERRANICQLNVELSPVQRAKLDAMAQSEGLKVKTFIQNWIDEYQI